MINIIRRKLFSSRVNLDIGLATHTGKVRTLNEDSILSIDLSQKYISIRAFAVADGMGGHEGGEIASKLALDIFNKRLTESINTLYKDENKPVLDNDLIQNMLIEVVQAANSEVYAQGQSRNNRMGTTIAAALIMNAHVYVVNVGDSRVYYLDGDNLRQITTDHSLVAELVTSGAITRDEIYTHPQRNIITRSLGTRSSVETDTFFKGLKSGNAFLICSDGLWEMVRDNQLKDILLQSSNAQAACNQLVEAANENGGMDNISVIVIKAK